jgi:hypothetical protein
LSELSQLSDEDGQNMTDAAQNLHAVIEPDNTVIAGIRLNRSGDLHLDTGT